MEDGEQKGKIEGDGDEQDGPLHTRPSGADAAEPRQHARAASSRATTSALRRATPSKLGAAVGS